MDEPKNTKKTKAKSINLRWFGLAMFLLGAFGPFAFHFATFESDDVHFHANFGLYVNGQRDEFKNFSFYEEVAACAVHNPDDLKTRVHMHDQNSSLVHVHAHAVTWGQFFANLGYTLGNNVLVADSGVYADGIDGNQLQFMLNGEKVQTIENRIVKSEDVLLINYGNEDDSTLKSRADAIPRDASRANVTADPAACSGSRDSSLTKRFKASLGIN